MRHNRLGVFTIGLALAGMVVTTVPAQAGPEDRPGEHPAEHWTAERRAAAVPRDLFLDGNGHAFIQGPDGLEPYGHTRTGSQLAAEPRKGPPGGGGGGGGGGGSESGPTTIEDRSPASGATIGGSATFSATVTDPDGVRSVDFVMTYPSGTTQTFAGSASGDIWSVSLNGFTDGDWSWSVSAKDGARKGGNTTTSETWPFTVDTGGGGDPGGEPNNAEWTGGGAVQTAAGRIYFQMPTNRKAKRWAGYVCSGTVVTDGATERSIILTAAHCIYDDANKYFARNVLFIPDQAGTTGSGTDTNCSNDPIGCWAPSFGVVDADYTSRTFPNNSAWDYGYYVVADTGAHQAGLDTTASATLDDAAGSLTVDFDPPDTDSAATALGYSYSNDPDFMHCVDPLEELDNINWWLGTCGLSGGSSGGPWLQPVEGGNGPIISVNSWGYTTSPGMAGPKLDASSASCLFGQAKTGSLSGPDLAVSSC